MGTEVRILADSISPEGHRLTTLECTYPRMVHAEHLRHRCMSFSVSSTRAVPTKRALQQDRVYPAVWGINRPGMSSTEELPADIALRAQRIWDDMADACIKGAQELAALGVKDNSVVGLHKQWANRPLEWFSYVKLVVSATEWDNFFELRLHETAQPEIRMLAALMKESMDLSSPRLLRPGEWHLPYIEGSDRETVSDVGALAKISAARCARTSYMPPDGTPVDISKDAKLADRLAEDKHFSPFEHQATPDISQSKDWCGWFPEQRRNFVGWIQHRSMIGG